MVYYDLNAERQAGKFYNIPFFLSHLVRLDEGIESRYNDYEADALNTIDYAPV